MRVRPPWWAALLVLLGFLFAFSETGTAAGARISEVKNISVGVYGENSETLVGMLKIERVFTDQRRVGFFRVKLLPVLVAQGVRLELHSDQPWTNWTSGFRLDLAPFARRSRNLEWRDVSVYLPGESKPRLEARRLCLSDKSAMGQCVLENVVVQTEEGTVEAPRALVLPGSPPGNLAWESGGLPHQWNLFTKHLSSVRSDKPEHTVEGPPL